MNPNDTVWPAVPVKDQEPCRPGAKIISGIALSLFGELFRQGLAPSGQRGRKVVRSR